MPVRIAKTQDEISQPHFGILKAGSKKPFYPPRPPLTEEEHRHEANILFPQAQPRERSEEKRVPNSRSPTNPFSKLECDVEAEFIEAQISEMLVNMGTLNIAATASIDSAVSNMENGIIARVFPKFSAKRVLQRATEYRQAETDPTIRWGIACIAESLAKLRLLSINHPHLKMKYENAKKTTSANTY